MSEYKILAVAGGFYFFGRQAPAPEGYIALTEAAMFGGFGGGLGLPGVARGAAKSTVTLDCFEKESVQLFPVENVYAVMTSVNLHKHKGTADRK